jgi:hypothetical protein
VLKRTREKEHLTKRNIKKWLPYEGKSVEDVTIVCHAMDVHKDKGKKK